MPLLADILGGSLVDAVKGIIGEFKTTPELKAQMLEAADANTTALQLKQLELNEKLQDELSSEIASASANIRAEATSDDKFTKRARPSYIYLVEAILFCNYVIFPLAGKTPVPLPDALFWLFGSAILGYTGARSWDKYQTIQAGAAGSIQKQ